MRYFTPNPDVLKAIDTFGDQSFRVTQLRDRFVTMFPSDKNKNTVRRWLHSFMGTFIKHGLLTEVTQADDTAAHYQATDKFRALLSGSRNENTVAVTSGDNEQQLIKKRLNARQNDILISLGATEELENLKAEFPQLAAKIVQQLHAFKEQNVRTLGKIKALESLLAHP